MSVVHPNSKSVFTNQTAAIGMFSQKNVLGKRMMLLSVLCVAAITNRTFPSWQRLSALILLLPALFLVLRSNSKTALLLTIGGIGLLFGLSWLWQLLRRIRGARSALIATASLGVVFCVLVLFTIFPHPVGRLLSLIGKSDDLTGRTVLWSSAMSYMSSHRLLGSGVEGFWIPQCNEAVQIATQYTRNYGVVLYEFPKLCTLRPAFTSVIREYHSFPSVYINRIYLHSDGIGSFGFIDRRAAIFLSSSLASYL